LQNDLKSPRKGGEQVKRAAREVEEREEMEQEGGRESAKEKNKRQS